MGAQSGKSPDPATLRRRAMDLLARREHATLELQRKLKRKGFEPDAVETVTAELAQEGLLSDTRCAEAAIRSGCMKGQGPLRVRADLSRRGIEEGLAERLLGQAEIDWGRLAREVRNKRFGASVPTTFRERARQAKFLRYRGFTGEQVSDALAE